MFAANSGVYCDNTLRDENPLSASSGDLQKEEMAIRMTTFMIVMEKDIKCIISKCEMALLKQIKVSVLKEAEVWFSPKPQTVPYWLLKLQAWPSQIKGLKWMLSCVSECWSMVKAILMNCRIEIRRWRPAHFLTQLFPVTRCGFLPKYNSSNRLVQWIIQWVEVD